MLNIEVAWSPKKVTQLALVRVSNFNGPINKIPLQCIDLPVEFTVGSNVERSLSVKISIDGVIIISKPLRIEIISNCGNSQTVGEFISDLHRLETGQSIWIDIGYGVIKVST